MYNLVPSFIVFLKKRAMESILIMLLPLKSAVIIIQIVCIYDLHTKTTLYFLEEKKFLHKSIFFKNENE